MTRSFIITFLETSTKDGCLQQGNIGSLGRKQWSVENEQ